MKKSHLNKIVSYVLSGTMIVIVGFLQGCMSGDPETENRLNGTWRSSTINIEDGVGLKCVTTFNDSIHEFSTQISMTSDYIDGEKFGEIVLDGKWRASKTEIEFDINKESLKIEFDDGAYNESTERKIRNKYLDFFKEQDYKIRMKISMDDDGSGFDAQLEGVSNYDEEISFFKIDEQVVRFGGLWKSRIADDRYATMEFDLSDSSVETLMYVNMSEGKDVVVGKHGTWQHTEDGLEVSYSDEPFSLRFIGDFSDYERKFMRRLMDRADGMRRVDPEPIKVSERPSTSSSTGSESELILTTIENFDFHKVR